MSVSDVPFGSGPHAVLGTEALLPASVKTSVGSSGVTEERWWSASRYTSRVLVADSTGAPIVDEWFFHGRSSRLDGPARTLFEGDWSVKVVFEGGEVVDTAWWFDGYPVTDGAEAAERASAFSPDRVRAEVRHSAYGVLLDEGFDAAAVLWVLAEGIGTVDGVRQILAGAPVEWVRAYESGSVW